jgi:putative DNA primase/helicase
LKDLSGGDSLTGRYLFQEYVEFKPMHSLWLYGNTKPSITGTDNGIWRRIVILPFNVTIPDSERIPRHILQTNLLSNKQGIFNWLIEGLINYREQGLMLPPILVTEMNDYRASLDETMNFISDCIIIEKNAQCMGSEIVNNYETWCQNHGISSSGKKKLYANLVNKGFEKCVTRQGHYVYFKGLRLNSNL